MLTLEQIAQYFPETVFRKNRQGALVEYLQYELLDSLFNTTGSENLSFIGGTAVHILHNSPRFSEDLDFDSFGLSFSEFEDLVQSACRDMEYKGFVIEYRVAEREAFHCYIRFPELLYQAGISPHQESKILIRIDSERKEKLYTPKMSVLNKFSIFTRILAAPPQILLAQKMVAVVYRPREKGRDLFDVSFLMGLASPDYAYIEKILGHNKQEFLETFTKRLYELDLKSLAEEVEPFLFYPEQKSRIHYFLDAWEDI